MRRGRLALDLPLGAAGEALVHAVEHKAQQGAAAVHIVCKEVVEMILHRIFAKPRGFWTGQQVLGLALELRVVDKDSKHTLRAREAVLGMYVVRLLLPHQLAAASDPLGPRPPKLVLLGAV